MKIKVSCIVLFIASLTFCGHTFASHIAGGELIYKWVSDSTYHVTFKLYRDCTGAVEPTSVSLCVNNSCTNYRNSYNLLKSSTINGGAPNGTQVSAGCPGYPTSCNNGTLPGYREWWYEGNVTLPSRCSKWIFSVYLSARNVNGNLNIGGGNTGFYVEATLNNVIAQGNSSAQYTVKPVPYVCANQPYAYNNGAVDINNDSLGYQIIAPETSQGSCPPSVNTIPFLGVSPSQPVVFNLTNNPIPTNNTFVLDTITGQLFFTPSLVGSYTLTLRVTEYRNRVPIATTMRDIQVHVISCNIASPNVQPDTTTINLVNGKIHDCGGYPLHFCFSASSTNTSAILVPTDNHVSAAPNSTLTYTGAFTNNIYGCFSWSPTTADTGIKILTITVTDSSCAPPGITEANTFTLPLYIFPTRHTNTDTNICLGKNITLTANGGNSYAWSVLPGGSPASSLSCNTCQSPVVTPTTSATTYVASSVQLTGCNSYDTIVVTTTPIPTPPSATSNSPLCTGDLLKLTGGTVATTYTWIGPAGFNATVANPVLPNMQAADTGMYYFFAQNGTCSSDTDSVHVFLYPPTLASNPDTTICNGDTIHLHAQGLSYVWSVLPGGSPLASLSCINCANPLAVPSYTTSYVVSSVQASCNTADTVLVNVVNFPQNPSPFSNSPCVHDTIKLHSGTFAATYTWIGPGGYTSSSKDPVIVNASLLNGGMYYITAQNGNCATRLDSVLVVVTPTPDTPSITSNSPICEGAKLNLSAHANPTFIYNWYGPGNFTANTSNTSISNVTITNSGIYAVTVTDPARLTCISAPGTYNVIIKPQAHAQFHFSEDTLCQNKTLLLDYATTGADSIKWNFEAGKVIGAITANPIQLLFPISGKETISVIVSNVGCADTTTHKINILPTPPATFHLTPVACIGAPVTAIAYYDYNLDVKFFWNFGSAVETNGSGQGPYTLYYNQSGNYVVSLVTQNTNCTSYPSFDTVIINPIPDASITISPNSNICSDDSIHFQGSNIPGYHYQWRQARYFNNDTLGSTFAYVPDSGYIYLNVTDPYGCKASDSIYIAPAPCCDVYFPNAFTPNGDNKNDRFRPISAGHHDLSYFRIFNRWGQLIYSSRDEKAGWDGKLDGVPADLDTYFYVLDYLCANGKYYQRKGQVMLIR